jgi:hypothetical protein
LDFGSLGKGNEDELSLVVLDGPVATNLDLPFGDSRIEVVLLMSTALVYGTLEASLGGYANASTCDVDTRTTQVVVLEPLLEHLELR